MTSGDDDVLDAATAWRLLTLRDENGIIPDGALLRALEQRRAMLAQQAEGRGPLAAGIARTSWQSLGPGNIGGRIRAIAIHPTSTDTMWVGSVSGGIWKTTNGGTSWSRINDYMGNLAITQIVIHPTSPSTMYAATGEGYSNADGIRGAGIFKSTDGGTTWAQLDETNNANFHYVNDLAIASNGNLAAATSTGLWYSTDGGVSWRITFSEFGETLTGRYLDVHFPPDNPTRAIAAREDGVVRRANTYPFPRFDNVPATFSPPTSLPGANPRIELAYAQSNPQIVYASVDAPAPGCVGACANKGRVYRSTDGGATFELRSSPLHLLGQGSYANTIWVDPTNSDRVVVGGLELHRSTDAGLSFTRISNGTGDQVTRGASAHFDHHAIVHHPGYDGTTNTTVFFANDGGIYKAANVLTVAQTSGWQHLNNTLGVTQFYGASVHPATGAVVGGTQGNGTIAYTPAGGPDAWVTVSPGRYGGFSAYDPTDANFCYGASGWLPELVSAVTITGQGIVYRSATGCGALSGSRILFMAQDPTEGPNVIAPLVMDPNNPNTLLAGGLKLWRTTSARTVTDNAGWSIIKASIGSPISAIAVQPGNSNHCVVGHNSGKLYRTTNCTAESPAWTEVDDYNRAVTSIALPSASAVYTTYGGFNAENVWHGAIDPGGIGWTDISPGLPQAPIRSVTVNPRNINHIYVGTEVGIFASENSGGTWATPHEGPADVSVDQVFFGDSRTLYAATHGRGVWKAAVSPHRLTISKAGSGGGVVRSNVGGIDCGATCTSDYSTGTAVTLSTSPDFGSQFSGWTGDADCSDGSVTMNGPVSCTATFKAIVGLQVTKLGTGAGTVTSSVAGINCGTACFAIYELGTPLVLTATAAAGSVFTGWTEDCVGEGTCNLTMDAFKLARATFSLTNPTELKYYLAEGATGPFFTFDIPLANPNAVSAPVTITYLKEDGSTVTQSLTLAPMSRTTVEVNNEDGLATGAVSTVVTSTSGVPIVVERSMFWPRSGAGAYYGSHGGNAVEAPGPVWYFGEGSQGFFDTYVLLANAGASAATVGVTFLLENGSSISRTYIVNPTSRLNVFAGSIPPLVNQSFSIIVGSTTPIIAERAMYFGAPTFNGGHESAGVQSPATTWFHAEGATGAFFDTYVLVGNPNATPATATFTFLTGSGATVTRTKTVPARGRLTVNVETEDPLLADAAVSTSVSADMPVISERAMYWQGPFSSWREAHNSFGVTQTATKWGLAEGRKGGLLAYDTYILLANPGATAAEVTVTFLREFGKPPLVKTYTVPPTSRFNVAVNAMVPEIGDNEWFGALITSSVAIAVERAMYNNDANGVVWAAGTNALATKIP